MNVELAAYTERTVHLPAPPETVARYFAQNEELLSQLLGRDRVTCLAPGLYRVTARGFDALGLSVTPCFEVEFVDEPLVTHMASKSCQVVSSSNMDLGLEARFEGEAQFHPHTEGTALFCWTQAEAQVTLPRVMAVLPHGMVKGALQALMKGAMDALSSRFAPLIQADFERWQRQGTGDVVPL